MGKDNRQSRRRVGKRDGKKCNHCGVTQEEIKTIDKQATLTLDHIIPIRLGGGNLGDENKQLLCEPCHKLKDDFPKKKK